MNNYDIRQGYAGSAIWDGRYMVMDSVGVLEDNSSSSRILEDDFEVLGLGL